MGVTEKCPGCGGACPREDGPVHRYMLSSPGCWRRYGAVLAGEYQDPIRFSATHRLTVDAYALQHPGMPEDKRAYRSVRLHYASLFLIFEHGWSQPDATRALQTLAAGSFDPLPSAPKSFEITVSDVWRSEVCDQPVIIKSWAEYSYNAWASLRADTATLTRNLR